MEQELQKVNSAVFKAELTRYVDQVRNEKRPIIVQRNNKDMVALVPLELLQTTKNKSK
ncbi:type II toxin-antitoxin system Phd/YefM family antitoxin [bacterium]|nr:type II toxin-antitoxin system Phd/YefM family antitoxin [bacterium]